VDGTIKTSSVVGLRQKIFTAEDAEIAEFKSQKPRAKSQELEASS
jgi:hypothetical protein